MFRLFNKKSLPVHSRPAVRDRRGAVTLEFLLLMPLVLLLVAIVVNSALLARTSASVSEIAQASARAGAVAGGAGNSGSGAAKEAMNQAAADISSIGEIDPSDLVLTVNSGAVCSQSGDDRYVSVTVSTTTNLPFLGGLLDVLGVDNPDITIDSTKVVTCEVVR